MKRKLSIILVVVFLFNIMPTSIFSEVLGIITEAKAETKKVLTREDVEKFQGRIVTSVDHTVVINEDNKIFSTNGTGAYSSSFNENEWYDIIKVDAGHHSNIGLRSDGVVVSSGDVVDKNWSNMIDVASGDYHIAAVRNDGTVVAAGQNSNNQCNVSEWIDIVKVAAGNGHTVGLKKDGTVVAVGNNYSGQCNVNEWTDIVQVSASGTHTVALKTDGTVVATGSKSYEQCNVESWDNIVSVAAGKYKTVGLKSDGTVVATGDLEGLDEMKNWTNIVAISAGTSVVGLKSDGTIVGAGKNEYGEINLSQWNDIKSISAGSGFTVGLKENGTVEYTGTIYSDKFHKLLSDWNSIAEIDAGHYSVVGLKEDGTAVDTRHDVSSWKDIKQVSSGYTHTVGLKYDGTLIAIGNNNYGELNVESWTDIIQVSTGWDNTVALRKDGTVLATGNNRYGQCNVEGWKDIVKVTATYEHTVGLKSDGTVVAVGGNYYGQCNVDGFTDIIDIATGSCHTVGLKSDGTVVAAGRAEIGACDVQTWSNIESIVAGDHHTVGITENGELISTGDNKRGQRSFFMNKDNVISVDKKIYKVNEPITIDVNNNSFYNVQGIAIELNENLYSLQEVDGKFTLQYTPNRSGVVDVKLPNTLDVFNISYNKNSAFKVIPLQSITTNKTQVTNGERVTITVNFTEPVRNDFTINLSGAINNKGITLKEVAGTNGTKFIASYIVTNTVNTGDVDIIIKNLTDNNGVFYSSYTEENVFSKIVPSAPVTEIKVSQDTYKIGDYISVDVSFDGLVDSQNVLMDISGAIEVKDIRPDNSGPNTASFSYYVNEGNVDGPINITIKNVKGLDGKVYSEYTKKNVCDVYAMKPIVTEFKASLPQAKLGDAVRFTATFNKPVQNGFYLDFNGLNDFTDLSMTEVEGSNKTEYYYDYVVKDSDLFQVNDITVRNIYDLIGNEGYYTKLENLCIVDGQYPEVTSVEMERGTYEQGDLGIMFITFNEAVKSNMIAKLIDGDNVIQEVELTEIMGSKGKEFEAYFVVEPGHSCTVGLLIENVEDLAGNTINVNKESIFKIIGDAKPFIAGGDNKTIIRGQNFDLLEGVSASDKEDGNITSSIIVEGAVDINTIGVYELVYSVTDSYGNTTKATRIVTVRTNEKPLIAGASNITIVEGDSFDTMAGVRATDLEDGVITDNIVVSGTVDTSKYGEYILTYSITDNDNNTTIVERIVTVLPRLVIMNNIPIITGAQDITVKVGDSLTNNDLLKGVTALDKEDGNLTSRIVVTSEVDTNKVGSYVVTYEVADSQGGKAINSIIVTVRSNDKPVIVGAEDLVLTYGEEFNKIFGVTAMDLEDGDLTEKIIVTGEVEITKAGKYELTYTVTDSDGNTTEAKRIVIVDYAKEDVNKDNEINLLDLSLVAVNYNKTFECSGWNSDIDINKDGIIDIFDIVRVSKKI